MPETYPVDWHATAERSPAHSDQLCCQIKRLTTIMLMPSHGDAEHIAIDQPTSHCNRLQASAGQADLFHLAHKVLLQKTGDALRVELQKTNKVDHHVIKLVVLWTKLPDIHIILLAKLLETRQKNVRSHAEALYF